jgi:hypothetical protein
MTEEEKTRILWYEMSLSCKNSFITVDGETLCKSLIFENEYYNKDRKLFPVSCNYNNCRIAHNACNKIRNKEAVIK